MHPLISDDDIEYNLHRPSLNTIGQICYMLNTISLTIGYRILLQISI